jgi:hypothetical protein
MGVNPLPQHSAWSHPEPCFLLGLADRSLFRSFAGLDLPGWELPREGSLGDASPNEQDAAVLNDDGSRDCCLGLDRHGDSLL